MLALSGVDLPELPGVRKVGRQRDGARGGEHPPRGHAGTSGMCDVMDVVLVGDPSTCWRAEPGQVVEGVQVSRLPGTRQAYKTGTSWSALVTIAAS